MDYVEIALRYLSYAFLFLAIAGLIIYIIEEGREAPGRALFTVIFFFPLYFYIHVFFRYQGRRHRLLMQLNSVALIGLTVVMTARVLFA
jgi:hypothetical protein